MSNRDTILEVRDLEVTFGRGRNAFRAVKGVSFDVYRGETFGVVGESGSGKTTIGRAVIRVVKATGGSIRFNGQEIHKRLSAAEDKALTQKMQMIFQDPMASLNERAKVDYIISEGLYNFHLFKDEKERMEKVENVIREVGLLPEHLTRYPHEFSGGQRQRVGLARSIVMEPEFIVADEPISALDVSIRAQVLNLLSKFQRERGLTYLFIAHDLSIVRFISDRIVVIYKGKIMEIAETEELFRFPLHPYTKSLMSAIPIPDPILEKQKKLFIYQPKTYSENETPALTDIGNGHMVYGSAEEIEKYKAIRFK